MFVVAQDVVAGEAFAIAIAFATAAVRTAWIMIALVTVFLRTSSSDQGDPDKPDDQDDQDDQNDQDDQLDHSYSKSCMSPDVLTQADKARDFTPFDPHDNYRSLGFEKSHAPASIDTQNLTNSEQLYNSGGLAFTCSPPAPSRASGALVLRFKSPSARHHPYGRSEKLSY
ncbi:hypothetical protein FRC12_007282 [Ceratobasidium sp. 428]|nr:hypothetical protein FRC12_007282 [Ceratobasidium sp. 428]